MHGALYVVADLEAYQDDPEAYLAKNPLQVKDDLLKFNRPRTEWKLDELAEAVKEMEKSGGRNFANGKQMFTVATCVACHKFGGQGNEFGPDLTKLDPKVFKSATDVLEHVLDPSLKIDDKYAAYRFVLTDDKVLLGMIVEEKDGVVQVIENPLASAKPREIKAGGHRRAEEGADVDDVEGAAGQADARRGARPAGVRVGPGRPEEQLLRRPQPLTRGFSKTPHPSAKRGRPLPAKPGRGGRLAAPRSRTARVAQRRAVSSPRPGFAGRGRPRFADG